MREILTCPLRYAPLYPSVHKASSVVGPLTSGPDWYRPPRVIVQIAGFSDTNFTGWTLPGKSAACPGQRPEGVDAGPLGGIGTGKTNMTVDYV